MTTVADDGDCRLKCWVTAAVIGVVVALFALGAQKGFVAALLLGALAFVLLGKLFIWLFCGPVPKLGDSEKARSTAAKLAAAQAVPVAASAPVAPAAAAAEVVDTEAAEEPVAEAAEPAAKTVDPAPEAAAVTPSKPLPGEAELSARKGEWRYEAEPAKAETAAKAATAAAPAAAEPGEEGTQPEALSGAREGGPDNLKEIKGVGPKLESLLHDLGIYHFDQIAGWSAAEVAWMDSNLKGFRGRVSRDDWIGQAKLLAAGGETEFSKRVEDGDVY